MALISASCLGQQVQETNLDSSSVQFKTIAAPPNALPPAAPPSPAATVAAKAPSAVLVSKTPIPAGAAPSHRRTTSPLALTPDGSAETTSQPCAAWRPHPENASLPKACGPYWRRSALTLLSSLQRQLQSDLLCGPWLLRRLPDHRLKQVLSSARASNSGAIGTGNNALGLLYVQNPSDGNLWVPSGDGKEGY